MTALVSLRLSATVPASNARAVVWIKERPGDTLDAACPGFDEGARGPNWLRAARVVAEKSGQGCARAL